MMAMISFFGFSLGFMTGVVVVQANMGVAELRWVPVFM
jgi:hypothetical protein